MQIENLNTMPTELPPATSTSVGDAAAAAPSLLSWKTVLLSKLRTRGALIILAAFALTVVGTKLLWPSVATAPETKRPVASKMVVKAKSSAAAATETAEKPARVATTKKPAATTPAAGAPVASTKSKSAQTTATQQLGALYIDDANGFSIRFPAGWSLRSFKGEPWVIDAGDGRVGLISVGFSPFPDGFTTDSIPPDWIARKIKRRTDTVLHGQGYATIGGRKALWSKSTGPLPMTHANPRMTRVNYILPIGDGRVLELRVAAAPEQFDGLVPVMKKAVETFKLHTPGADSMATAAAAPTAR
jgi:hypothetical protein